MSNTTIRTIDGGKFDIHESSLIINYESGSDPIASIRSYLVAGYNSADWNGSSGIVSSDVATHTDHGVGYADNSDFGAYAYSTFSGQAVDSTCVLIRYTYKGDANLDGMVEGMDVYWLSQAWLGNGAWSTGDFNYNGTVNATDLGILALNWQAGT